MYPYKLFLNLDLYSILITVGLIACMILIRVLSDRRKLSAKWQNFVLITMIFAVVIGYGSAVLFQALYNIERDGGFQITKSTGQTFFGGLIGGAASFMLIYFGVGYLLFRDNEHLRCFPDLLSIAACGITVAHGFGRLGCLMAGCCYGRPTDAWYGIEMVGVGKRIPVQLYEAVFLFLLCVLLVCLYLRGNNSGMALYMMLYGAWRFGIEYLRDDYRGNTVVSFLTPSQFIAVILFLSGLLVLIIESNVLRASRLRREEMQAFREQLLAAVNAPAAEPAPVPASPEEAAPAMSTAQTPTSAKAEPAAPPASDPEAGKTAVPTFGIIDASGIEPGKPVGEESFVREDRFRTDRDFIKPESFRYVPGQEPRT